MKERVSKIKNQKELGVSIRSAVQDQGGWDFFLKKGDRVFLKPNFNTADVYPGSTDMLFLKEVVRQVLEQQPREVLIGASSTMLAKTEDVLIDLGVYELEDLDPKVKVLNLDRGSWVKKKVPQGRYLKNVSLAGPLEKADKLIFLPCLKTHFLSQYTGALKLAVGLMRPRERLSLHARHLQEKIAELNSIIKPDLVVMDARVCFISRGPMKGPTRRPELILASTKRTALDLEGVKIIQDYKENSLSDVKAREIPQIKRALELGIE